MQKIKNHKINLQETKNVVIFILILNLIVLLAKVFAGIITKSLSILGDAAHSTSDALNNLVALAIITHAHKPADEEHPYGHGKFETLGAFGIVAFLAIAAVEIIRGSLVRLIHPVELPLFSKNVVYLLISTLIVNLLVWIYERKKGKELKSDFLIADSSHTGSDVLITISVLASQYFIAKKMFWTDPILAIVIAGFIVKAGYEIVKNTVPILVDERWVNAKEIRTSAMSVHGVTSCYDIYSRQSPDQAYIECKIKVTPKDVKSAHKIADEVENKLKSDFGNCKVTVHVEP